MSTLFSSPPKPPPLPKVPQPKNPQLNAEAAAQANRQGAAASILTSSSGPRGATVFGS